MVQRETVSAVYADLKELRDVLKRNRENPHMIRICENLMRLTSLGEDEAADLTAKAEAESSNVVEMAKKNAADCEHKVHTIYGRCVECGECQHTNVRNGTCLTCDEIVEGEKPTGETQAQAGS